MDQSAISVLKNPEHHDHMKHLDLHFYWLRDTVESGLISPSYIPTSEMVADILTKPLSLAKLDFCRRRTMIFGLGDELNRGGVLKLVIHHSPIMLCM
jgi:hypothetical protein